MNVICFISSFSGLNFSSQQFNSLVFRLFNFVEVFPEMAISFAFRVSAATLICIASVLCLLWLYNFRVADLEHVGELFGRLIGADDVEDGSTGKGEFINYYMVVFVWFFTFSFRRWS